jgi:hypothetical protein
MKEKEKNIYGIHQYTLTRRRKIRGKKRKMLPSDFARPQTSPVSTTNSFPTHSGEKRTTLKSQL